MKTRFPTDRAFGFGVAALLAIANWSIGSANELERSIDRILGRHSSADGPGVAVLAAYKGAVVYAKGHGLADLPSHRKITPTTRFDLASVSKQFTATAVLMLADEGKLRLDARVKEVVPDFKVPVLGRPVTIRDLLCHQSGLDDYTAADWSDDGDDFSNLTAEDHLRWWNETQPLQAPGTEYDYNNSNYVMLSLIVERVSGTKFSKFLAKRIFVPLEMHDTFVFDDLSIQAPNVATGYRWKKKAEKWRKATDPSVITGDGNIFSSVNDLGKWDRALRDGRLLKPKTQERAFTAAPLDSGKPTGYGFGWEVEESDDHPWVGHSGSWAGTATYISQYLADDVTVIVLSNDEDCPVADLAEEIANLFE